MKLNLHTKLLFLLGLLINNNIIICASISSQANKLGFINTKDKNYNKAKFADNFRFSTSRTSETNSIMDRESLSQQIEEVQNVFTMSTLIESSLPTPSESDQEQEVIPSNAESGTYYTRRFLWFNAEDRNPRNAINQWNGYNYWESKHQRQEDWWQADFSSVTKFDSMEIQWRAAPTEFRVEFSVQDNGNLIALTENHKKFIPIVDGKTMSKSNVSLTDAIIFQKPVFAKNIRITMKNPLNNSYFSIKKVRFFNKRSIVMIYNQTYSPCNNYCLYVNTDKPRVNSDIVAMDCLDGMATGDNRELFTFYNDKSLRLYNAQHLCVGKNSQKEIVLMECDDADPTFKLETRSDSSLYFQSLEDECIYMNTQQNKSQNFIDENTEILSTSEYDKGSFKKENMKSNNLLNVSKF